MVFGNVYSQKEKLVNITWVVDYYIINGVKSIPSDESKNNKIIFNSNSTFNLTEEEENVKGVWQYFPKKNIIKLKLDDFLIEMPLKIKLLNENAFAWETIDHETGLKKITYMKKSLAQ